MCPLLAVSRHQHCVGVSPVLFSAFDPKQTFARLLAEVWIGQRARRSVRLSVSLLAGPAHPKIEPRQRYAPSSFDLWVAGPTGPSIR